MSRQSTEPSRSNTGVRTPDPSKQYMWDGRLYFIATIRNASHIYLSLIHI